MSRHKTKRALITGAAMGLGKALADNLVSEGWQVVSVDREKQNNPDHITCDLSNPQDLDELFSNLSGAKPFDLVVLNAAVSATGNFEAIPASSYQTLITLNVETPMIMASRISTLGLFSDQANLVFLSSLSHFTGYPGAAVYAATKDAIAVYAKSIRKPFAKKGICVSCVFPGPMKTQQAERHSPPGADADKRMFPEVAARLVLKDVFAGKHLIFPGSAPKLFAMFGKTLPSLADRAMRKIIYEKLDKEVH